jgi:hypothetical protein
MYGDVTPDAEPIACTGALFRSTVLRYLAVFRTWRAQEEGGWEVVWRVITRKGCAEAPHSEPCKRRARERRLTSGAGLKVQHQKLHRVY